jgi:general secretion pathway protein K
VIRAAGDQRGVALIIVLLVLALLLTIAGEFALAMRLEGRTTLNFAASVAAGHLAQAGYQRAVAEIVRAAPPPGARPSAVYLDQATGMLVFQRQTSLLAPKPPTREDLALGPGRFSYRITDEGGRINVNESVPTFRALLEALEVSREVRDVIVASVQDWTDKNDDYRLNGAESEYYLGLPIPYRAKNARLDSVEELLQVKGVTPQIFYGTPDKPGLVEYVTVFGRRINVNTAGAPVLRALGLAEVQVEQLRRDRPYLQKERIPATTLSPQASRELDVTSRVFRIEATGEIPGQGRRTLLAIVEQAQAQGGTAKVDLKAWRWAHEDRATQ